MADSNDWGACNSMSVCNGCPNPTVNNWTCWSSDSGSAQHRRARKLLKNSWTEPCLQRTVSSPKGLLRKGGPKRVLTSSTNMHHDGVPVSHSKRWYHNWDEPVMWKVANHTLSSSSVCWSRKNWSQRLSQGNGSSWPSNVGKLSLCYHGALLRLG